MATLPPVNARQREVLERIVDGIRPVTRADSALVNTVTALSNRRLVEKKKTPGGGWIALATDAGRDFLLGKSPEPAPPPARPRDAVVHEPVRVIPAPQWQPETPPPRFEQPLTYSIDEAAHVLGMSPSWLRTRARARDFPHVRFGRTIRFTGPQLVEILEACTSRPLPNYYFGNPWGLVPGSHTLKRSRAAAAERERTQAADSWGRPLRGRRRPQ